MVCTPPFREEIGRTRRTLDGEREDKHHHLRSTIESCHRPNEMSYDARSRVELEVGRTGADDVVVLLEQARVASTNPPLGEEGDRIVR
jgi:hypothetical protein